MTIEHKFNHYRSIINLHRKEENIWSLEVISHLPASLALKAKIAWKPGDVTAPGLLKELFLKYLDGEKNE